jgi:hypothetical protein
MGRHDLVKKNAGEWPGSESRRRAPGAPWPLESITDPVAPTSRAFVAGSRWPPSAGREPRLSGVAVWLDQPNIEGRVVSCHREQE